MDEQGATQWLPLSPAAGSMRFRVVSEETVASGSLTAFRDGHDLVSPLGGPWGFPLLALRTIPKYRPIYDLLLRHSPPAPPLLSAAQDGAITKMLPTDFRCRAHSVVLDSVLEPFVFDFATRDVSLTILDTKKIQKIMLRRVTARANWTSPYSGESLRFWFNDSANRV
jgi:hypothetical protein